MLKEKADLLDWITGCWPQLEEKFPEVLYYFKERNREIVTSWNSRTILDWMYVLGYEDFLKQKASLAVFLPVV
jgi:hypothetical protein